MKKKSPFKNKKYLFFYLWQLKFTTKTATIYYFINIISESWVFLFQDKPLIKFKSHLYYEEKDEMQENLKALKPLPGSKITYFLNGKSLGTAFQDIYRGEYYPAAGLYKQAHIKFNFGPRFKHPPVGAPKFRPMCERARELEVEQSMADMRFFSDKEGLKIDNYVI